MRKTVLITGSSKGFGKALALTFAKNNYDIILHGRNKKDLKSVKEEVLKNKVNCDVVQGDLCLVTTINNLYKIAKKRNIFILINNAGVSSWSMVEKITDWEIMNGFQTNLIAIIKLTRKIYPLFLKKKKGIIVNINSTDGLGTRIGKTVYCSSKFGLGAFTDVLKLEAELNNIRVMNVYPGIMKHLKPKKCMDSFQASQIICDLCNYEKINIDKIVLRKINSYI